MAESEELQMIMKKNMTVVDMVKEMKRAKSAGKFPKLGAILCKHSFSEA